MGRTLWSNFPPTFFSSNNSLAVDPTKEAEWEREGKENGTVASTSIFESLSRKKNVLNSSHQKESSNLTLSLSEASPSQICVRRYRRRMKAREENDIMRMTGGGRDPLKLLARNYLRGFLSPFPPPFLLFTHHLTSNLEYSIALQQLNFIQSIMTGEDSVFFVLNFFIRSVFLVIDQLTHSLLLSLIVWQTPEDNLPLTRPPLPWSLILKKDSWRRERKDWTWVFVFESSVRAPSYLLYSMLILVLTSSSHNPW